MQQTTQPIDRVTLLAEANKLIREHEDTLAGMFKYLAHALSEKYHLVD